MDQTQKKSITVDQLNLMALIVVIWPGMVWYVERVFDHSDEPCGLLALVSLGALAIWRSREQESQAISPPNYVPVFCVLLFYIATYNVAPHLVAVLMLIFVLWFLVIYKVPAKYGASFLGLAALSLPLISSLNFYAGYPLRILIAAGACIILNVLGLSTSIDGTMLTLHGQQIAIDAPCSGVSMLWTALFVAMLCAAINSLTTRTTILIALFSIFLVIAGNIWRATTLVIFDSFKPSLVSFHMPDVEPSVHLGVGVFTFVLICASIIFASFKLQKAQVQRPDASTNASTNAKYSILWNHMSNIPPHFRMRAAQALVPLCLIAAILPAFTAHSQASLAVSPAVIWPTEIDGNKVVPVQTLGEEEAFARDFPGQMRRFTDGTSSYFVRVVWRETRQLHPSSDCFKGMGYEIEPGSLQIGAEQTRWSQFKAIKQGQKYLVMERIVDASGNSWTDVSAWYWSVVMGKTKGPWTAITIARRIS